MLKRILMLLAGMVMVCQGKTAAQSLMSPRATAIGAYGPLVSDTRDFGLNPAGLTQLPDWEFSAATYLPTSGSIDGFVFHGLTLGRHFLGRHAAAMQFSNGTALDVVFPAQGIIIGPDPTTVDSRISYSEQFALGYAFAILPSLSAGLLTRLRQEKVTDTQYRLQDTVIVRLPDVISESNSWNIDFALQWRPADAWSASLVGRNLVRIEGDPLPGIFGSYQLPREVTVAGGLSYVFNGFLTAGIKASTEEQAAAGLEARVAEVYSIRGGVYADGREKTFVQGFGVGLGWKYEFLEFGISYLHFLDEQTHTGTISPADFDPGVITNLDLNRYTTDRISLSVSARFGADEAPLKIDGVRIVEAVYPSRRETAAYMPLGFVSVTNASGRPVAARATFHVDGLMNEPTESREVYLMPGERTEIPLTALFDERLNGVASMAMRDATITVRSRAAGDADDRRQARIVIHGRNAWNGEVGDLRFFVTPDDPDVIRYSRDVLFNQKERFSAVSHRLESLEKAKLIFDALSEDLIYVGDPKLTSDVVQYPSETLEINGGDCDDMTVCFTSLLSSIGISTALIDVVPPDDPGRSHVYFMFDSGVDPAYASEISENPKRYVVRTGKDGRETIWIPVEPTVITDGFEQAWKLGAEEYLDDVEVNLGMIRGWVRIFDIN